MKVGFYTLIVETKSKKVIEQISEGARIAQRHALEVYKDACVNFAKNEQFGSVSLFENGERIRTADFKNYEA